MKTKIIPFDLETAKKIQAGEIEGKIVTKNSKDIRIICWDRMDTETPIVFLMQYDHWEGLYESNSTGEYIIGHGDDAQLNRLLLEVPDNDPQFKPFDKVLVRNGENAPWVCDMFSLYYSNSKNCYWCIGGLYQYCIPYVGNEHLLGTIDKPKAE